MRNRILSAAIAVLLLPLAGCAPPDEAEEATPEATPTTAREAGGPELPGGPDYGARAISCDTVGTLVEMDTAAARLEDGPIEIALEDGELVTRPERAVVSLGEDLQWRSENLHWVVAFRGGLSPYHGDMGEETMSIRGAPGGTFPVEIGTTVAENPELCGYYYYAVAAYDPDEGRVYVSDPPIWVTE